MHVCLDGRNLCIGDAVAVAREGAQVSLAPDARLRICESSAHVDELLGGKRPVYGVTTGFGKFADVVISPEDSAVLQRNLLLSHACGVGDLLPDEVVRAVLLLRANALAYGCSGARAEVVETLIAMLNAGVHPAAPSQGSVGASGDLAPLAHTMLVLIGEGVARYRGETLPGAEAMARAGIPTIMLRAKEGLALINGTQVMTAIGALAVHDVTMLARVADIAAAMATEALRGTTAALDPRVHAVRPHPGQAASARNMLRLIEGSEIRESHRNCPKVQDAYSLRCAPQVHGAARDAIGYARRAVETEMNSATDNPLIFMDNGDVISGGNFHGEPIAMAMDFLGIAASELGSIAERRTERMVNPQLSGLPPFLTEHGGLNSGMMIAQYTAAALASEDKILASPAVVDSIPTSGNQEDHVSMGTIAARKARRIAENVTSILAIEIMCSAQGMDFVAPLRPGAGTGAAYRAVRDAVEHLEHDRVLADDIASLRELVRSGALLRAVERAVGPLE
ncbi:MAG: histidine ammonia-lyase [Clostridia bacterium]|nr:histidine ammonia-lyase [Clostridia bacterium]